MFQKPISYLLLILVLLCSSVSCTQNESEDTSFSIRVKIAMRAIGNDLLVSAADTTSLVLPVRETPSQEYVLSFEEALSILPDDLLQATATHFKNASLPEGYRVEVLRCIDGETAYSYEMTGNTATTLVPCRGRALPKDCYIIIVTFTESAITASNDERWFYLLVGLVLAFLGMVFYSRYSAYRRQLREENVTTLGSFRFYPEQHKIVKEAVEIPLSNKECELLELLVSRPNEVIKREELTKKVWEDNGVIVGRSLDTYISKLRKKLKEDERVQITNIHGVGYKLEIDQ